MKNTFLYEQAKLRYQKANNGYRLYPSRRVISKGRNTFSSSHILSSESSRCLSEINSIVEVFEGDSFKGRDLFTGHFSRRQLYTSTSPRVQTHHRKSLHCLTMHAIPYSRQGVELSQLFSISRHQRLYIHRERFLSFSFLFLFQNNFPKTSIADLRKITATLRVKYSSAINVVRIN